MYSPKIKEELVSKVYRIAKIKNTKMTTLVNEILSEALNKMETEDANGKHEQEAVQANVKIE